MSANIEKQKWHDCKLINLATVTPKAVEWLWHDRIPLGMFSLMAGQPGVGKTTISHSIASVVSRGGTWPFTEHRARQGRVVLLTAEDDIQYTLAPRLIAADAKLHCIEVIQSVTRLDSKKDVDAPLLLSEDMDQLDGVCGQYPDIRLIIFDPISAYLGAKDSHRDADVRQVLGPLTEFASKHNVAVLGITHLSKNSNASAIARFMGSTGIIAAARTAFLVAEYNDEKMMLPVKSNVGPKINGLTYEIVPKTIQDGIETSCVQWTGESAINADEALGQPYSQSPKLKDAMDFLERELADGPKRQVELEKTWRKEGHTDGTINRAQEELKIEPHKDGFNGGWLWYTEQQWDMKQEQEKRVP